MMNNCPGSRPGCSRGDHSAGHVHHPGQHPELPAPSGLHQGHRCLVRGLRGVRVLRPPGVRPRQLRFKVCKTVMNVQEIFLSHLNHPAGVRCCEVLSFLTKGFLHEFYSHMDRGVGQCCHELFELFDYSNSWDRIVVFGIRIRSFSFFRILFELFE